MRKPHLLATATVGLVLCAGLAVPAAASATVLPGSVATARATTTSTSVASARVLLRKLRLKGESHASTYARSRFTTWVDANKDGENTRAEVLKAESLVPVKENSSHTVISGRWWSKYDAKTYTTASSLDIDHLVPLEEAWVSGAYAWSTAKRTAYANDIGYGADLIAVSAHANRSKGDKEPGQWLPPRTAYRCNYVKNWIAVKYRWNLAVNTGEQHFLTKALNTYCTSMKVAMPHAPRITALAGVTVKPSGGSGGSGGSSSGTDPQYATCAAAKAAGAHTPYYRGKDVEYAWYRDADHDGIVCE